MTGVTPETPVTFSGRAPANRVATAGLVTPSRATRPPVTGVGAPDQDAAYARAAPAGRSHQVARPCGVVAAVRVAWSGPFSTPFQRAAKVISSPLIRRTVVRRGGRGRGQQRGGQHQAGNG
ncbi:hypothetical protein ACFYUK_09865 [Nonomuraea wenchangensis]